MTEHTKTVRMMQGTAPLSVYRECDRYPTCSKKERDNCAYSMGCKAAKYEDYLKDFLEKYPWEDVE